jgi:hypothetical protein
MSEKSIEYWCLEIGIENYEIKDGILNVDGHVDISHMNLSEIPIRFGVVSGDFFCYANQLITLDGSPIKVGGNFDCSFNELTSLIGGPKEVGNGFYCQANKLSSIEGGPTIIKNGDFRCFNNPIYEECVKYNSYTQYKRSIKLKELLWTKEQ